MFSLRRLAYWGEGEMIGLFRKPKRPEWEPEPVEPPSDVAIAIAASLRERPDDWTYHPKERMPDLTIRSELRHVSGIALANVIHPYSGHFHEPSRLIVANGNEAHIEHRDIALIAEARSQWLAWRDQQTMAAALKALLTPDEPSQ